METQATNELKQHAPSRPVGIAHLRDQETAMRDWKVLIDHGCACNHCMPGKEKKRLVKKGNS